MTLALPRTAQAADDVPNFPPCPTWCPTIHGPLDEVVTHSGIRAIVPREHELLLSQDTAPDFLGFGVDTTITVVLTRIDHAGVDYPPTVGEEHVVITDRLGDDDTILTLPAALLGRVSTALADAVRHLNGRTH